MELSQGEIIQKPKMRTKGYNSVKDVGGVTELVLSTLCDNAIYLYQVLSKILVGFQSYDPEQ